LEEAWLILRNKLFDYFIIELLILINTMKVPFEKNKVEKSPYNPQFVTKIKASKKNFSKGKYTIIKVEDLWK
jgi:hypothetical protein